MFLSKMKTGKWHNQQATLFCLTLIGQKSVGQKQRWKAKVRQAVHSLAWEFFRFKKSQQLRPELPLRVICLSNPIVAEVAWANHPIDWHQQKKYGQYDYLIKAFDKNCFEKGQTALCSHPKRRLFLRRRRKKTVLLNWKRKKTLQQTKA